MLFRGYERSKPVGRQYERLNLYMGVKIFYSKDKARVMRNRVGVVVGRSSLPRPSIIPSNLLH